MRRSAILNIVEIEEVDMWLWKTVYLKRDVFEGLNSAILECPAANDFCLESRQKFDLETVFGKMDSSLKQD